MMQISAVAMNLRSRNGDLPEVICRLVRQQVDHIICVCRHSEEGWPNSMYGVSKLCEATYTRILAQQLSKRQITVSACCPGYVNTDMSSHRGVKTTAGGADTPTFLSLLSPTAATGLFWSDRKQESF